MMPEVSFGGLLIVVAVAFAAPLALGFFPRSRLPSPVVEIVLGIAIGPAALGWVTVDEPIRRDPQSRIRMAALPGGKPARTDIYRVAVSEGKSAVRCVLHTGRTHQIRVHLAFKGFPLLADAVYGGRPVLGLTRQALHATRLRFAHPLTGAPLAFEAPLPADLAPAWLHITGGA